MKKFIVSFISVILCFTLGNIALAQEEVLPDLVVSSMQAPASASNNQQIEVSWTVKNQGNGTAIGVNEGYWVDDLYLSSDNVLDSSDIRIVSYWQWQQPLAPGANYTVTYAFAVPQVPPGSYYLLVKTDDWPGPGYSDPPGGRVLEASEDNNVLSQPITILTSDLVVSSIQAPASASNNQQFEASWTVKNQGNGTAIGTYEGYWVDALYLSNDTVLDPSDTRIVANWQWQQPLASGANYTVAYNINLPQVAPGTYYLLAKTDDWPGPGYSDPPGGRVYEVSEGNNVLSKPITIVVPDLVVASVNTSISSSTPLEDLVSCSWTVKNQGNGTAIGTYTLHRYWWATGWEDKVYLSTDAVLDSSDIELASYERLEQPLAPDANYTTTVNLIVPKVSSGNYYLLIKTDAEAYNIYQRKIMDYVYESNESNNVFAELLALPDLMVSNIDMPPSASAQQPINISWTVKNQGLGKAEGSWTDTLYLSTDVQLDEADTPLAAASRSGLLLTGNNYTTTQTLSLPNVTAGNYYLIVKTDSGDSIYESQKWNNVLPRLITIGNTSNLSETSYFESNLVADLLSQEAGLMDNATVSGDLNGTFNLTGLEMVSISSGPFAGKGSFQGNWTATLENSTYQGQWQGVSYLVAPERKVYLKGTVSGGEASGIVEGYLRESTPDSGIYDQYSAVWRLGWLGGNAASLTLNLEGKLSYGGSHQYPSTNIYLLQAGIEGVTLGHYTEYISSVLTQLRVTSPNNPYFNRGFSTISYTTKSGSGEGWTYDKVVAPGRIEMNGMFTNPLLGILTGVLDETKSAREMQLSIERIDLGSPPQPELAVKVWGPERVSPGQTITYIIEYRNDGLKAAGNAIISCALNTFVKYISASSGVYYSPYAHRLSWKIVNLSAKTIGYLTFKVEVAWGLPQGFSLEQNAFITNIGE